MTEQRNREQAAELLDTMSDDELAAWVAAGDFTSIRDVRLSDDDATRIAAAVAAPEVAGYDFGLGLGVDLKPQNIASLGGGAGHLDGHKPGQHVPILRVAIKDVLISGFQL